MCFSGTRFVWVCPSHQAMGLAVGTVPSGDRAVKVAEESHVVRVVHRISSRQLEWVTHQHAYQVAAIEDGPKGGRGCGLWTDASLSSFIVTPGRTLCRNFFLAICPTGFKSCRCMPFLRWAQSMFYRWKGEGVVYFIGFVSPPRSCFPSWGRYCLH